MAEKKKHLIKVQDQLVPVNANSSNKKTLSSVSRPAEQQIMGKLICLIFLHNVCSDHVPLTHVPIPNMAYFVRKDYGTFFVI